MSNLQDDISRAGRVARRYFDSDIDSEDLSLQRKKKELEADRYYSDTKDRQWLAQWATCIVSLWLFFVLLILVNKDQIGLSDAVLITLLSTTTLNVLGLSFIVLRGHFTGDKTSFPE